MRGVCGLEAGKIFCHTHISVLWGLDNSMCQVLNHVYPVLFSDHGIATRAHRTLGLMPTGTICHSNFSPGHYPILILCFQPDDELGTVHFRSFPADELSEAFTFMKEHFYVRPTGGASVVYVSGLGLQKHGPKIQELLGVK